MRTDHLRLVDAPIAAMGLAAGVEHYLARLAARGARPNTLRAYGADLAQFVRFLQGLDGITLVALISHRHVSRWLDDLNAQGISARSQARKLSVLRSFVKHARREGWLHHDPTQDEAVRFRRTRVIAPEIEQLHAMVDAIDTNSIAGLRDRAMLRLALDSGLRISEVASVDLPGTGTQTAIDLKREIVHVLAKGGDTETVPFNARTVRMLEDWLRVRAEWAAPGELALFVTRRGRRPSRQSLHQVIVARAAAAGLGHTHWHLIRHRRISQVVAACGLKVGQQFARHANEATTGEYGRHADSVAAALVREQANVDAGRNAA